MVPDPELQDRLDHGGVVAGVGDRDGDRLAIVPAPDGAVLFVTSLLIFLIGLVSEQVTNLLYSRRND